MDAIDGVKAIIARQMSISKDDLTAESDLREIGLQSVDVVDLMFALEAHFGIDVPFSSADPGATMAFRKVGDIAKAVTAALSPATDR
jgi:acyl carrier protein